MKQMTTAAFLLMLTLPQLAMARTKIYAECTSDRCISFTGGSSEIGCAEYAFDPSGSIYQNSDGTYDAVALDGMKIRGLVKTVSSGDGTVVEFKLPDSDPVVLGYYGVSGHPPVLQQKNENRVGNVILQQCKLVEPSPF